MTYFFHILLNNIIPLCIMIGIGVLLQRAFKLDIKTLSKLNMYLFSPAIIFLMVYESTISLAVLFQALLFFCLFFTATFIIAEIVVRIKGYNQSMKVAMRNSILFYNSANYGIPLNQLVFAFNPFALSIQIIMMMVQSLIPNTYGVYSVNSYKQKFSQTAKTILSLPVIYLIPLAFIMRGFQIPIPAPIYVPIDYVAQAFIATALVTLGVQLGSMRWVIRFSDVLLSNVLRLCIGPVVGFLIVLAMGIEGLMAQVLVLSVAAPTSLISMLLAVEFDNEPEFSSQTVFSSTLFSIVTVTIVIYFLKIYFPYE